MIKSVNTSQWDKLGLQNVSVSQNRREVKRTGKEWKTGSARIIQSFMYYLHLCLYLFIAFMVIIYFHWLKQKYGDYDICKANVVIKIPNIPGTVTELW